MAVPTILPEVSIDGNAITETEINNLLKSCVNAYISVLSSTSSGLYDYSLYGKRVNKTTALQHLQSMIQFCKTGLLSAIPKEEYISQEYDIDQIGQDQSDYWNEEN